MNILELVYGEDFFQSWRLEAVPAPDRAEGSGRACAPAPALRRAACSLLGLDLEAQDEAGRDRLITQLVDSLKDRDPERAWEDLASLRRTVLDKVRVSGHAHLTPFHEILDSVIVILGQQALSELRDQAGRDALTGLANRRRLQDELPIEINRARRADQPLTVMMIDINHLKETNDRFGHAAGDRRIVDLANRLGQGLRLGDSAYRIGGDEFVLVLPSTGPDAEHGSSTRIEHPLIQRICSPEFTDIAWGAAYAPIDAATPEELLSVADRRLREMRRRLRLPHRPVAV